MASRHEPLPRIWHISGCVDKHIVQGGRTEDLSEKSKQQLSAVVDVFDSLSEEWKQEPVRGNLPKPGTFGAASASSLDGYVYSFGGTDGRQFFNTLHRLDTRSLWWVALSPQNAEGAPIPKCNCGMAVLEESIVVVNGLGLPRVPTSPGSFIKSSRSNSGNGWTNELHIYNLSEGVWSSPATSGENPPPSSGFTITAVDKRRAVMFGGYSGKHLCLTNDVYIFNISSVTWRRLNKSGPWPEERSLHAACCLNYGQLFPELLMTGGWDEQSRPLADIWILDVNRGKWRMMNVVLNGRFGHTLTALSLAPGLIEVMEFGGSGNPLVGSNTTQPKLADTTLMQFKLQSQWKLVSVADNKQIGSKQRVIDKLHKTVECWQQYSSKLEGKLAEVGMTIETTKSKELVTRQSTSDVKNITDPSTRATNEKERNDKSLEDEHHEALQEATKIEHLQQAIKQQEERTKNKLDNEREMRKRAEFEQNEALKAAEAADDKIYSLENKIATLRESLQQAHISNEIPSSKLKMMMELETRKSEERYKQVLELAEVMKKLEIKLQNVENKANEQQKKHKEVKMLLQKSIAVEKSTQTDDQIGDKTGSVQDSRVKDWIIAERTVIITSEEQDIEWEGYGLKLHIPQNSLPEDVSSSNLIITVSRIEKIQLPTEHGILVSAIYSFNHSLKDRKFCQPVTVQIQHCVFSGFFPSLCLIQSNDMSSPFQFFSLEQKTIDCTGGYSSFELDHFCSFGVWLKWFAISLIWTLKPCAVVYYTEIQKASFEFHLYVVPGLEAILTEIDCNIRRMKTYKKGHLTKFQFEQTGSTIELLLPETPVNGWSFKHINFKTMPIEDITTLPWVLIPFQVKVTWSGDMREGIKQLEYDVKISGTDDGGKLTVYSPIECIDSKTSTKPNAGGVPTPSGTPGLQDFRDFPPPTLAQLMEVVGVDLKPMWKDVGVRLGLENSALEAIRAQNKDNIQDCMREVFIKWKDQMTSEYSWMKLAEIISSKTVNKPALLYAMRAKFESGLEKNT